MRSVERLREALKKAHADLDADGGLSERDCECSDCAALAPSPSSESNTTTNTGYPK